MEAERVAIRPFEPADQPQIRAPHDRTAPAGQKLTFPQRWFEELDDIPTKFLAFWVAVTDDKVIGMVGVMEPDEEVPEHILRGRSGVVRLQHMRVAPERQRTGMGRRLTQTVLDWAQAHNYQALVLETTPQQVAAVNLYEATGFTEVGRSMIGKYELVWLERSLAIGQSDSRQRS